MSWRRSTDPDFDLAAVHAVLRLRMLPALSDARLTRLLLQYHPCEIIEHASAALLGEVAVRALNTASLQGRAERALAIFAHDDVAYLTIDDAAYPSALLDLAVYAPPVLFARGQTQLLSQQAVAIIGARNCTEYGVSVAELFASELARCGVVIVSGLARGIDSIAHSCALNGRGDTMAVLGCGIDVYYPRSNVRLQERIAHDGLLLSEFAPGETAFPHNFPKRNRLIALLARAVLVIEAGPKSGTRRTVDWALEHSVDVFAVPGPIGRYASQGTNEIIQEGALVALSARDILERYGWARERQLTTDSTEHTEIPLLRFLEATPVHVDDIARRAGKSVTETLILLTELELSGHARQHPGKRFSRALSA